MSELDLAALTAELEQWKRVAHGCGLAVDIAEAERDALAERIEKARAACTTLGPLAVTVLGALDGES